MRRLAVGSLLLAARAVPDGDRRRRIGVAPPPRDGDGYRTGEAAVAAGDRLVVVGGAAWTGRAGG